MDNPRWPLYWRLSATSTLTRRNLFALGLPPPNTPVYLTYSELVSQSQGGLAQQGYINADLLWSELTATQLKILNGIVDAAILAGIIYGTVDKANGTGINSFVDISGVPHPLTYETINDARGIVYRNVELRINNISVTADPSSVF